MDRSKETRFSLGFLLLVFAALTPLALAQTDGGNSLPQEPVEPAKIRCSCRSLPIIAGSCTSCSVTTVIVLHKKRARCTPFDLQTGDGCEPLDGKCERRMGVTLSAPCNVSVVLDTSAECGALDSDSVPCPVGAGNISMDMHCSNCVF